MAARIRTINGHRVAVCAALTLPESGDVYINDSDDHALRQKYLWDYETEGLLLPDPPIEREQVQLMQSIETKALGSK